MPPEIPSADGIICTYALASSVLIPSPYFLFIIASLARSYSSALANTVGPSLWLSCPVSFRSRDSGLPLLLWPSTVFDHHIKFKASTHCASISSMAVYFMPEIAIFVRESCRKPTASLATSKGDKALMSYMWYVSARSHISSLEYSR